MENERTQKKPDILALRDEISQLHPVTDIPVVRRAFQRVVFDKLFLDGYICCTEGLYPPNKEPLTKALKQSGSAFAPLLERNAGSYPELLPRLKALDQAVPADYQPTDAECRSVVYAVLETGKSVNKTLCVNEFLHHCLGKTRFSPQENFLIADDIELREITSLGDFVTALEELPAQRNNLFRGHSNINYGIQPSLFRDPRFYRNEYMMYQELVIRCPESFAACQTHLDFLVEMQHYGLPTRLLDFSLNPLVGLYFACENPVGIGEVIVYAVDNTDIVYSRSEKSGILSSLAVLTYRQQRELYAALYGNSPGQVCAARQELLDEIRIERPSFNRDLTLADLFSPVFVKPPHGNRRIAHQSGIFLLWGLDGSYYSDEIRTSYSGDKEKYRYRQGKKKVIFYIPPKRKPTILRALDRVGINKAYIYPEIDDVADYIKNTIL